MAQLHCGWVFLWLVAAAGPLAVAAGPAVSPEPAVVVAPDAVVAPRRIVSLNLCTDQLLMALVEPARIASITWLSRAEGDPALLPLARRLPVNHGRAEEVLAQRPDLVLAGRYTTFTTRALLRRVGVPLLEVEAAQDWEGIRRVTRQVARAVDAEARGEALLARMDAQLAALAARPAHARPRVVGWNGAAEDVPGADTMFHAIVTAAGADNLAARPSGARAFDVEGLLRARPDVLLRGTAQAGAPALRTQRAGHRALRALPGLVVLDYPEAAFACGVPGAASLALDLGRRFDALAADRAP